MNAKVIVLFALVAAAICAPTDESLPKRKRAILAYPGHHHVVHQAVHPIYHVVRPVIQPVVHAIHPVSYQNSNLQLVNPYTGLPVRFSARIVAAAAPTATPDAAEEEADSVIE